MVRRLEPQGRWDKEATKNVIGEPWRVTNGRWTVDRPEIEVDPIPIPPLPVEGARIQRKESPSKTLTNSEPLLDAQVATQSKATDGCKPIQIVAECELKNVTE